ncbi:MAG TPA: sugar phosphate isomerase/epimerase family protein [Anaerolineales bacterium]|nr:sugar phosphate isomerase/epimerase family protein [Anaerolineales bacterium]
MNPITFSTLACPSWGVETIIAKAAEFGYDGIEWRGGPQGHVRPDMPTSRKSFLRQQCLDAGLISTAVTAYTGFVSNSAKERQANVDELRHYSELAAELGADYVRTFLGELPEGTELDPSIYGRVSDCLHIAADDALSFGVKIAVEPHDDFVRSSSVVPILSRVQHSALGVIWDLGNASSAGEDLKEGFAAFKDRLAYVQVKDGKRQGNEWQLCPLGEGNVLLRRAFELLMTKGYAGTLSVEWEYAWHPELDPPEIALPAALRTVQELLAAAQPESA